MYNVDQAVGLVIMFNNLDIEPITDLLSDNVIFTSDWVPSPIVGRKSVLNFLEEKLDTMLDCVEEGGCKYKARLIELENDYPNEYLVELAYKVYSDHGRILMQVRVNEENGLIESIEFIDHAYDSLYNNQNN
jgi:hypothetical protein